MCRRSSRTFFCTSMPSSKAGRTFHENDVRVKGKSFLVAQMILDSLRSWVLPDSDRKQNISSLEDLWNSLCLYRKTTEEVPSRREILCRSCTVDKCWKQIQSSTRNRSMQLLHHHSDIIIALNSWKLPFFFHFSCLDTSLKNLRVSEYTTWMVKWTKHWNQL